MVSPRWGLGDAALAFVAGYVASGLTLGFWIANSGADQETLGTTAAGLFGLWLGLGGVTWWASSRKGSGQLSLDFGLRFRWPSDLSGIGIGIACQFLLVPLLSLPVYWLVEDAESRLDAPAEELNAQAGDTLGFVVLGVLLVVGAPLVEELFYRGLLLRSMQRRMSAAPAIVITGLLFGAAHVRPDAISWMAQMPALAGFGMVLGWVASRAGRLGPAIVAHAAFNLVTVLFLYAERST